MILINPYAFGAAAGYLDPFWPTVLFSMRKRRAAYSGNCVKVRNTTTNVETDVGFDANGWCDSGVLASLITGTQNLAVVTWYDQSGNGLDVTQATQANQPTMSSGGTLYTQMGGKPCIRMETNDHRLQHAADAAFGFGTSAWTVEAFLHVDAPSSSHFNSIADFRTAGGSTPHICGIHFTAPFKMSWYNGSGFKNGTTTIASSTSYEMAWSSSGSTVKQFLNGSQEASDADSTDLQATRVLVIGNGTAGTERCAAWFGEIAIAKGTQQYTASFTARSYT